jgi:hypothetical protein
LLSASFLFYLKSHVDVDGKRVLAGTSDGQLQWQPILDIMLEILDSSPGSASVMEFTAVSAP